MNRLPLVLAIEPDLRQAAIVKRVLKERVQAELVVVDSRDAAIAAIQTAIPDVVLVSMLLSPRDEDDLIQHLRALEGAAHLQTHTIPQLASALGPGEDGGGGGLFSAFRRKKQTVSAPAGCDPDLFADEIRTYLQRAAERKREAAETGVVTPLPALGRRAADAPAAPAEETVASAPGSSWASPFEWRPSSDRRTVSPLEPVEAEVTGEPLIPDAQSPIADPLPPVPDFESLTRESRDLEPPIPAPSPAVVHTPAPFAVWARKETAKSEAGAPDAEVATLFARRGMPDGVASVAYAEGVRIRRVRVRAAKDTHPSVHGAMLLGRRMLAELSATDPRV